MLQAEVEQKDLPFQNPDEFVEPAFRGPGLEERLAAGKVDLDEAAQQVGETRWVVRNEEPLGDLVEPGRSTSGDLSRSRLVFSWNIAGLGGLHRRARMTDLLANRVIGEIELDLDLHLRTVGAVQIVLK